MATLRNMCDLISSRRTMIEICGCTADYARQLQRYIDSFGEAFASDKGIPRSEIGTKLIEEEMDRELGPKAQIAYDAIVAWLA